MFVAKYNASDGSLVWAKSFSGSGSSEGLGLAVNATTGDIVVGGYETRSVSRAPSGARVARWLKIDSSGNKTSDVSLVGDDMSYITGIAMDLAGNVYLGGTFKSNLPLQGIATLTSGKTSSDVPTIDAFFAKLTSTGSPIWSRAVTGTSTDDYGTAVATDLNGNLFGGGVIGLGHFVARFDSNGAQTWLVNSSSGGQDYTPSLASDGRGGVYWAGTFSGTFSTGSSSFLSGSSPGSYLLDITSTGAVQWGAQSSGRTNAVTVGGTGDLYISGYYTGSASFGNFSLSTNTREIFSARLDVTLIPTVITAPVSQSVAVGQSITLTVIAGGTGPFTYQWRKNGINISGATSQSLVVSNATSNSAGLYDVVITNSIGSVTSSQATITVVTASAVGRIINLSILTSIASTGDTFTMGYVVGGSGTSGAKPLVIRAAGPSLGALGVSGTLADPKIVLFAGSSKTGENDNWGGDSAVAAAMSSVGAFAYASSSSKDAAALANIVSVARSAPLTDS
jgi:hypothetical protein